MISFAFVNKQELKFSDKSGIDWGNLMSKDNLSYMKVENDYFLLNLNYPLIFVWSFASRKRQIMSRYRSAFMANHFVA